MSDPVVLLSTGDVVGPAGGVTDNSMVLFDGTSGKKVKGNNAVVTAAGLALLDDVNAAAQLVTLGLTATATELNYTDGVTSSIQTQLDGKAASSHTHSYLPLAGGTLTGRFAISYEVPAAPAYNTTHMEIASGGTNPPSISFHRPGYSAAVITHTGDGINVFSGDGVSKASVSASAFNGATCNLSGRATVGDSMNSGWYRSTGTQGWYNETYNGGIYMSDATYVRTYNNKSFLCNNVMRVEGTQPQVQLWDSDHGVVRYLYADAGTIGFLNSSGNWNFTVDNAGNAWAAGSVTVGGAVNATNLLGQGQTWQDLTYSREPGVTYTNSTGRPIVVQAWTNAGTTRLIELRVGGILVDKSGVQSTSGGIYSNVSAVVPDGVTYMVTLPEGKPSPSIQGWVELR